MNSEDQNNQGNEEFKREREEDSDEDQKPRAKVKIEQPDPEDSEDSDIEDDPSIESIDREEVLRVSERLIFGHFGIPTGPEEERRRQVAVVQEIAAVREIRHQREIEEERAEAESPVFSDSTEEFDREQYQELTWPEIQARGVTAEQYFDPPLTPLELECLESGVLRIYRANQGLPIDDLPVEHAWF
jgi:hypothetical protein